MKKGLLLLIVAGAFLVSCGGGGALEKEAAQEFCDCYGELAQAMKEASSSTSADATLESASKQMKLGLETVKCQAKMDTKYTGQLDLDIFKEEIKKIDKAVFEMAEKNKVF